jgi:hypothetical protein
MWKKLAARRCLSVGESLLQSFFMREMLILKELPVI